VSFAVVRDSHVIGKLLGASETRWHDAYSSHIHGESHYRNSNGNEL